MSKREEAKVGAGTQVGAVELAVVIPAWRVRFLGLALDSLRAQTDGRFRVYVGDDGSPEDVAGVVAKHGEGLDWVYHRFEENLGGRDLMGHWERCFALTGEERWVWFFSDDDELEPGCVAAFYAALEAGVEGAQVLRFDHDVIGADGVVRERPEAHPRREQAEAMLGAILDPGSARKLRAQDHIFAREGYREAGGWVSFPLGMYADTATWLRLAEVAGVVTIPGARVRWRAHEDGTSSGKLAKHRGEFLRATSLFCAWVLAWVERREPERREARRREIRRFFCGMLHRHECPGEGGRVWEMAGLGVPFWGGICPRLGCAMALGKDTMRRRMRSMPGMAWLAQRRAEKSRARNRARIKDGGR